MTITNQQIQEDLQTIQMIKDVLGVEGESALDLYRRFKNGEVQELKYELDSKLDFMRQEFENKIKELLPKIETVTVDNKSGNKPTYTYLITYSTTSKDAQRITVNVDNRLNKQWEVERLEKKLKEKYEETLCIVGLIELPFDKSVEEVYHV